MIFRVPFSALFFEERDMFTQSLKNTDVLVILDTETTGISYKNDEIIELAAVKLERIGGEMTVTDRMDDFILLSEGRHLPPEITALTGITEQMLTDEGKRKRETAERFAEMIGKSGTLTVAYNAQFDMNFLYWFLHREGLSEALKNTVMLDAMTVYKDRRPYPHKLCNAIDEYKLVTQNTHRAIDDAQATLELMCAMEKECADLDNYINLFGYSPKWGISGSKISSVTYKPQYSYPNPKLYL